MSGYALYVAWGYGLSALVLGAVGWVSWRAQRAAESAWRERRAAARDTARPKA